MFLLLPAAAYAQVLPYPGSPRDVAPQADSPLRVSPPQFDVVLDQGASTHRTLTIENTDADQAHAFELAIQSVTTGAAATKRGSVLAGTYAYVSDVFDFEATHNPEARFLRFNLDQPGEPESVAAMPVSYAGDFAFGDAKRLYLITHPAQMLQVMDLETGRRTDLGTARPVLEDEFWTDLATDPTDGTLYGSTFDQNGWSYLYEIHPATGEARRIARIQDAYFVVGLAVSDQGQLYGYSLNSDGDVLLEINKYTGVAHPVGPSGLRADGVQSMDFDPLNGTLYLAVFNKQPFRPELRTVNLQTGEAVLRASFNALRFGFLAMPSRSFVEPSVVEGTVPPGGRVDLDVTFDAAHMLAGSYHAVIHISTTDEQPDVEVPVQLQVRGQALINVRRSSLDFGAVMVGGERSLPLSLQNLGSDTLRITGISSNEAAFALNAGSMSRLPLVLPPGLDDALTVFFRPDATGPFAGDLVIESNDPVQPFLPVSVQGEGRAAPRLSFTPEALAVQVVQGGGAEYMLTLANTGPAALAYDLQLDANSFGDALEPPVLVESFDAGIPSTWSVIDHAGTGLVWQSHTEIPAVDNWTSGDGPAAMVSSNAERFTPFDTELRTPELTAPSARLELRFHANYADKGGDATDFFDVDLSTDGGASWTTVRRFDENLGSIFNGPGASVSVDLLPYLNRGDTFLIRWRYHDASEHPDDWYVQIDDVEIAVKTKVLELLPGSGTVAPQDTEDVRLVFDAEGLKPGSYDATLQLTTNDPLAAERTIPLALSVVGGISAALPALAVRPHQSIEVPLHVQGQMQLETFAFTLAFDPALLDLLNVRTAGTLAEEVALDVDTSISGRLTVATRAPFAAPVDLSRPNLPPLVVLRFQARDVVRASDLTITSLLLNGITPPGTTTPGRLSVEPLLGDVTLDGAVTGKDMYRLSQHILGVDPLIRASRVAADVSGDGEVTLVDASLLRRFIDGNLPCFPADATCTVASKQGTAAETLQTDDLLAAGDVPDAFTLESNFPNPFNPTTTIAYALPEAADVSLVVYNLLGQPVRTLVSTHQSAGRYTVIWDGRSDGGTSVASGTYLYRLRAGSFVAVQRMTLVK